MPWQVYNPNPENLVTGDCVIRAICAVTGMDWRTVHRVLCALSEDMGDIISSNRVWWRFLRGIGFRQVKMPDTCPDCYTVRQFALDHPNGKYVLAPSGHAVAVIDGDWWDVWDSGGTVPIYYFEEDKDDVGKSVSASVSAADLSGDVSADAAAGPADPAGDDVPDDPRGHRTD